jgi:hypothetical protein
MFTVPPEYEPQWSAAGLLSVQIDGRRFDAEIEDERLIVHGAVIDGQQFPVPPHDFIVRFDTGIALSGGFLFGAPHA